MALECKKCPYFVKQKNKLQNGMVIMGFCKLRNRYIADQTLGKEFCKDRAVIEKIKSDEE